MLKFLSLGYESDDKRTRRTTPQAADRACDNALL